MSAGNTIGFDVSYWQGDVSTSSLDCLQNSGYKYAIVQATKASQAALNPYVASVVGKCRTRFNTVDVYIFPNIGQDAKTQTTNYVNALLANGVLSPTLGTRYVIDIEGTDYWYSSCSSNQAYLKTCVDTVNQLYKSTKCTGPNQSCVQIYTNQYYWNPIMCGTSTFSSYPLWYAHYDNSPNFNDFVAFGGWNNPYMKQYAGDVATCSTTIDKNYRNQ